jgi:hypothetical protein
MSLPLPKQFTIHCLFHGEKATFHVMVAADESVTHLKDSIKDKNKNDLANVDARKLTLYYVDDVEITSDLDLSSRRPLQNGRQKLQEIFGKEPKDTAYIIVVPPGKQTYSALSFPLVFLAPNILVMRCHTFACLWIR